MTWPFDDSDLPLHDGVDVGGAQERSMAHSVGGYQGIRTVEELNPDGSLTRLRTRWGRPIFETDPVRASSSSQKYRGFVAKASSRAVLFDPYTLTVLDANYTPALNTYSVQDFATSWNVPVSDTTDWYDVVMFDGQTIKVNAMAMPTLGIVANQAFQAIPYVINRNDASDQYGNAERNATEKRVFAVGRSDVQSWGGSGVIETLTPTDARTEDRAMTVGQRVDFSTDTAWLGQLFYPAAQTWDGAGEWYYTSAQVQMLLTSTYLVKVAGNSNVAMTPPSFSGPTASSGSMSTNITMPPTAIAMYGDAHDVIYANFPSLPYSYIRWRFDAPYIAELNGFVSATFTRTSYAGIAASSESQSGRTLDYSASNTKQWDVRSERPFVHAQFVPYPTTHTGNAFNDRLNATYDTLFWVSGISAGDVPTTRGNTGKTIQFAEGAYPTQYNTRNYETQVGEFSVMIGAESLVELSIYRQQSSGEQYVLSPNLTYYDTYLGQDYSAVTVGMGLYTHVLLDPWNSGSSSPLYDYKKVAGVQPPAALAEINAEFSAMADAYATQICYESENNSGYFNRPYGGNSYYYSSINPSVNLDNSTMSWNTKDYILYDDTNGVYISVESSFVGVDTSATLDVILKVQTRHHTTTQILGQYNYTYSQLVNEREIGSTGKYAMPSPQIRAIFAPLYQEQGSFKGAHYVTEEEEGNGATPAHLFNFLLYLKSYGDLATVNDDNLGPAVHFVPCNLLEMLYAFVFSQEYGVALSGDRYPVTFTTRYNDMMNTLFTNAVRVSVRDGVQGNWSDSLGSDFAAISTVSLHRT